MMPSCKVIFIFRNMSYGVEWIFTLELTVKMLVSIRSEDLEFHMIIA